MNSEQLRNLLNEAQETPSAHCWNAIQQQLTAMASGATAVSASKAAAQAAGKGIALSGAKIAVISGSIAVVATIATVAIVNLTTTKEAPVPVAPDTSFEIALTTDTPDSLAPFDSSSETAHLQTASYTDREVITTHSTGAPIHNAPQNSLISPLSSSEAGTPQSASAAPSSASPVPVPGVSSALPANTPQSATPARIVAPSITKPADSKPAIKQIATNPENDPLASQYLQEENPDYRPPVRIEIPNTITPNGDGYNDFFTITGLEQCDDYQLIILNQARKEILRTQNYQNDWNAANQEGNTFYYILIYKINNIQEKRTGVIYVLK